MPPIVIGAGIAAVGGIAASSIANKGASNAAKTQQQSTNASLASQQLAYDRSAAALAPWQQAGLSANALQQGALGIGDQAGAKKSFDTFLDSINYKWQLGEGLNAVNSGYAGAGTLQSGAAMKGINDYGQNMARGAFSDWYGALGDQANRGFGAASAQAGVSQNLANNTTAINSANANALANLQIQKANNTAGMIGGLGQIGGYLAGSLLNPKPANLLYGTPYG